MSRKIMGLGRSKGLNSNQIILEKEEKSWGRAKVNICNS